DHPWIIAPAGLLLLLAVALLLHSLIRRYLISLVQKVVRRSRVRWDEVLFEARVPHRASALVPLLVLQIGLPLVPHVSEGLLNFLMRLLAAGMVLVVALTIDAFVSALHMLYLR